MPEKFAQWTTAYINDLPDSAFAVIESGGKKDEQGKTVPRSLRHFPIRGADGKPDAAHVRNALARLPQSKLSAELKARARKKIQAAAKQLGIGEYGESTKDTKGHEEREKIMDVMKRLSAPAWKAMEGIVRAFAFGDDGETVDMEVFRVGDYGEKGAYSEADLEGLVRDYDPDLYEAPVVIDHVREGDAHGWVKKIWRVGGTLWARVRGLSDELREKIRDGAMRYRSIEVMPDFEGTGRAYFYGLSFLGAKAPAVKGLVDVELEEGESVELVTFSLDFGSTKDTKKHEEKEEKEMPDEATVKQEALTEFKESEEYKKLQEQAKRAEAGDEAVKKMGDMERQAREEKVDARLAALGEAGKILPWQTPIVREAVLALSGDNGSEKKTIEFDDGKKKETVELGDALVRMFERQGEIVVLGEIAKKEEAKAAGGRRRVDGKGVRFEDEDVDEKVRALMAENTKLSYRDALRLVGGG